MFHALLALHLLALLILLALAGLFVLVLREQRAWQGRAALLGALAWAVAALVLEPLALQAGGVASWLAAPGGALGPKLAVAAAAAALFGECGRLLALRLYARRGGHPLGGWWSFGAGCAAAELLASALERARLLWLLQAPEAVETMLAELPDAAADALQRTLEQLGPLSALWLLGERLAGVAFQLVLTLLVAGAVSRRAVRPFAVALLLHFVIGLPAAGLQLGLVPPWALGLVSVAAGLAACRILRGYWPPQPVPGAAHARALRPLGRR